MTRKDKLSTRLLPGLVALVFAASIAPATEPDRAARGATIGQLDWLAGAWVRVSEAGWMEEHWLAPRGGMMLGLHRDVFTAGKAAFEYLRIEEGPEGLVYQASPGGRPPTPFLLVEIGERRAVFANPDHDFPQRILYRREGDHLHARIEGDTPSGHSFREWTFVRKASLRKAGER